MATITTNIKVDNSFVNASKTYKVDRILPARSASVGWAMASNTSTALANTECITLTNYSGSSTTNGVINLNKKSEKAGETQYVSTAGEGLSPAEAVKIGFKTGKNIYGFSTLAPERLANTPDWVQVVISVEELFRCSRITKVLPGESGSPDTYECYGETGHLPIMGWLCVRVPKHVAFSEDMLGAYMSDLISAVSTSGSTTASSWTKTLMDLVRGDVSL